MTNHYHQTKMFAQRLQVGSLQFAQANFPISTSIFSSLRIFRACIENTGLACFLSSPRDWAVSLVFPTVRIIQSSFPNHRDHSVQFFQSWDHSVQFSKSNQKTDVQHSIRTVQSSFPIHQDYSVQFSLSVLKTVQHCIRNIQSSFPNPSRRQSMYSTASGSFSLSFLNHQDHSVSLVFLITSENRE